MESLSAHLFSPGPEAIACLGWLDKRGVEREVIKYRGNFLCHQWGLCLCGSPSCLLFYCSIKRKKGELKYCKLKGR